MLTPFSIARSYDTFLELYTFLTSLYNLFDLEFIPVPPRELFLVLWQVGYKEISKKAPTFREEMN